MDDHRKRLLYRAHHRGFREADLLIGAFADAHLEAFTDQEAADFAAILEVPDQDLYAWLVGRTDPPPNFDTDMLRRMQAFRFAEGDSPATRGA
ncbi:MAG: succinate dehydrogenase assembly factor 2 [Pseudomonadota bacterium]